MSSQLKLSKISPITNLTQNITRILGMNPSPYTLQGTNTYLIQKNNNTILIDSGDGTEEYLINLSKYLNDKNLKLDLLLITHGHYDHVGGIQQIAKKFPGVQIRKGMIGEGPMDEEISKDVKMIGIEQNEIFENTNIQAIYTPGHCLDHYAFYDLDDKSLYCGDLVLGESSGVIADLETYMQSMEIILKLDFNNLFSAHGKAFMNKQEAFDRVYEQYNHRKKRYDQILQIVHEKKSLRVQQILAHVYPDLQENLVQAAINNIVANLKVMEKQKLLTVEFNDIVKINSVQ